MQLYKSNNEHIKLGIISGAGSHPPLPLSTPHHPPLPPPPTPLQALSFLRCEILVGQCTPVLLTTITTALPSLPPSSQTALPHQFCAGPERSQEEERGEREERIWWTEVRGTMAALSALLKTWVILQALCLALAQVVSEQGESWDLLYSGAHWG